MVTKTFECPKCNEIYDIQMEMNQKAARCPKCNSDMNRIFNSQCIRPGADGKGFYGIDKK